MNSSQLNPVSTKVRAARTPASEVTRCLRDECARMNPGERIPSRGELMVRYAASERAVLKALDELRLGGVIVSRNGSGTYVTESGAAAAVPRIPSPMAQVQAATRVQGVRNTVIALLHYQESDGYDRFETVLSELVRDFGFNLLTTYVEPDAEMESLEPFAAQALGFIVLHPSLEGLAGRVSERGHRVVFVGWPAPVHAAEVPFIAEDRQAGAYLAMRHLAALGHQRVLVQMGVETSAPEGRRHLSGVARAEREARRGRKELVAQVVCPGESRELLGGVEPVRELFHQPGAPTAVIAWSDHDALKFLNLLSHAGLRVPGHVSLIGHGNTLLGSQMFPPLTTVDGGIEQQMLYALEFLGESPDLPRAQSVLVIPALNVRGSTGPVSASSTPAAAKAS